MRDIAATSGLASTRIGVVTEERVERVGRRERAPVVLSSTKHRGLVPSDEYFKNRTIYSGNLSNYKLVRRYWFAYATNHLSEGSIGLQASFEEACVSPIYTVFSCTSEAWPPFMHRMLKWWRLINQYKVHEQATVDRRGAVRYGDFARIAITLPPLPEQRQIAEILDTVDEAIRKTEEIIAKLKQVKQGLLRDLLTRGIDENGELRDPDRHPEQFKDSPLGRIPKQWDVFRAQELCSLITKGTTPPPSAFRTDERTVRYLRVDNLTFSGALDLSLAPLFIDRRTHDTNLARSKVFANDVLMNIVGPPLGKVALVPEASHAWNVNQAIAIFRVCSGVSAPFFATWLLGGAMNWFRREAKQTSGQVNLTLEMCANLPVPVPAVGEQAAIHAVLTTHQARMGAEDDECNKLRLLKQGLMEDLLTTRVRVTRLLKNAAE